MVYCPYIHQTLHIFEGWAHSKLGTLLNSPSSFCVLIDNPPKNWKLKRLALIVTQKRYDPSPQNIRPSLSCNWETKGSEVSWKRNWKTFAAFFASCCCWFYFSLTSPIYLATAALRTWVRKNPPLVLSMTCWYTDCGGWFMTTVPSL